jgi:hypothetical protein
MYRIPPDLDLSPIVGEFTTQVKVGQFDIQFTFGSVNFAIQSPVTLVRGGETIGGWRESHWPDAAFFDVMNASVLRYDVPTNRDIVIYLENGIEIHLQDSSDQFESMQISFEGAAKFWVI